MGNNSSVWLDPQPFALKAASFLPLPHPYSMWLSRSERTRGRERWYAICLLALVSYLAPAAASADISPHHACSDTSLPKGSIGCRSAAGPTSTSVGGGDPGQNQGCLPVYPRDHNISAGAAVSPCDEEPPAGGPQASETDAEPGGSLALLYPPEGEKQLVGWGSLIDGRYLLVDLLHPRPWEPQSAAFPEKADFGGLDDLTMQHQVQPQLPAPVPRSRSCCNVGLGVQKKTAPSGTTGLWPSSTGGSSFRPPISAHPLLLSPGLQTATTAPTGAALAAALVSVRSNFVVPSQRNTGAEGFCIDPFIFLRAYPFWLHWPSLPSPNSRSRSSGTTGGRYRVFGRLGGGAYGEVWRAISVDSAASFVDIVLKRMRCGAFEGLGGLEEKEQHLQQKQEEADRVRRGFAREVFFGFWLRELPHIARFLEVLPANPLDLPTGGPASPSLPTAGAAEQEASAAAAAEAAAAAAAAFLPEMNRSELLAAAQSFRQGCEGKWLVFANEGSSLTHLFFVADRGGSGLLEPSALWWHLKAAAQLHRPRRRVRRIAAAATAAALAAGDAAFLPLLLQLQHTPSELLLLLRSLLQQLLLALDAVHRRQVTHRDVKLENVLMQPSLPPYARLADWGSAVSNNKYAPAAHALKAILGDEAPSPLEETDGYQPPEVWAEAATLAEQQKPLEQQEQKGGCKAGCDNSRTSGDLLHRLPSYDMWGVGLIFLKLALGTPTPFESLDRRKSARLARASRDKPLAVLRRDLLVTALGDLCLIPWASDRLPAYAAPTAVAPAPQHSLFSSLKSAVVSATDGFFRRWASLFRREKAEAQTVTETMQHQEMSPDADVGSAKDVALRTREMRKEELFELLSRVRRKVRGGELVIRQELAVQRQEHPGVQAPFDSTDDAEGFVPHETPVHDHEDCNDALFAEALKARDVAGIGIPNPLARDLLRKLLAYDPQERLTAEAALQHPWFAVSPEAASAVEPQKI